MATAWWPLLKSASVGLLGGVTVYHALDVAGEVSTFMLIREEALKLANEHEALKEQIGHPFSVEPWYEYRLGYPSSLYVAQIRFQLTGSKQVTDVDVQAVRGPGVPVNVLYNLFGRGEWRLLRCDAMFPGGKGLVRPRTLLPHLQVPNADGTGECEQCKQAADKATEPASKQ